MRVLLVEDDTPIARSIQMMLQSEGFVVDVTDLGEDGLEIGKLYDYDIIVLDLLLPDIDGYEVLRRLRAARVQTPILILSGLNEPNNKVKGLGFGADDYLTKPFDKAELIARTRIAEEQNFRRRLGYRTWHGWACGYLAAKRALAGDLRGAWKTAARGFASNPVWPCWFAKIFAYKLLRKVQGPFGRSDRGMAAAAALTRQVERLASQAV